MNINIKVIPHDQHRYDTLGDYWFTDNGDLEIRVSDTGNWKHDSMIIIHELVEVLLCKARGIQEPDIMAFDVEFEKHRKDGDYESECGDDPAAPYRKEHRTAENFERLLGAELGVHYPDYDRDILDFLRKQDEDD